MLSNLKNLQKVRDILEEVTHVYVELTVLGDALEEEGWLAFASTKAAEIILDINNMIYTDVGYAEYFAVHDKLMSLWAGMIGSGSQTVKDWLFRLIEADNITIKDLVLA